MILKRKNFIIKFEKQDEEFVKNLKVEEIYKKVHNFFDFDRVLNIGICFLYSIEEYEFFSGQKFENWMCAFVGYPNLIFLFSPSVIEELTIHKKTEITNLITHELSHIFYGNSKFGKLTLINEGIATYLSFYDRHKEAEKEGKVKIDKIESLNIDPRKRYSVGFFLVDKIIQKSGKEKLFEFLKNIKETDSEDILKDKLKEITGLNI